MPLTYFLLTLLAVTFGFAFWLGGERGGRRFPRLRRASVVLQIGAVLAGYFVLRPGRGVDPKVALEESHKAGKPLFLDLYSNY